MDENVATAVERFDSHFAQRASSLNMTAELNLYEWQTIRARLVELEAENATLANMAKRLEAAERDARRWRFLRAEIALGRPGAFEAMSAAIPDDAPETKEVIEGCLDSGIDAAIDATQEGEG